MAKKKPEPECGEDDLSRELFFVWRSLMAAVADVQASIDAQATAIAALAAAIAALPASAATPAELDTLKAGVDKNTAALPTVGAPPAPVV